MSKSATNAQFCLRFVALVFCLVNTILLAVEYDFGDYHNYAWVHSIEMTATLAGPNSLITITVLVILIILEVEQQVTELCLLTLAGVLNFLIGVVILALDPYDESEITLGVLMIICGIIVLIDVIIGTVTYKRSINTEDE